MNCRESIIGGKVCRFFESGQPSVILLQPSARHETATLLGEAEQIAALSGTPFLLVAFDVDDWMVDLMPWLYFGALIHQGGEGRGLVRWSTPIALAGIALQFFGTVAVYNMWM